MKVVFDIEADALLEDVTKIHCLSYKNLSDDSGGSITDYQQMRDFVLQEDLVLIGHNLIRYDIPVMNKLLGISIKAELIDTLALSWTLYPQYVKHGLEAWGEFFGVPKPPISNWKDLPIEDYVNRCSEDVKINVKLWSRESFLLNQIYSKDTAQIRKYIQYLSFKMDCVREQEEVGIRLNVPHCELTLGKLSLEKEEKVVQLASVMPQVPIKKKMTYDNALTDENGNIFQQGDLFFSHIEKDDNIRTIDKEKIIGWKEPNPNSSSQIKDWLYSLGWIPETFKHVRDKEENTVKKVPQIGSKEGQGELCDSVMRLFSKEPNLELLNGLGVLSHRIGILKKFLRDKKEDRLYPSCSGLTNTLRLQHSVVVNLPGIDKKYGDEIRKCLIADEGMYLCGCDLSGIEDNTKRHYIYKYDPEYVSSMSEEGYDPHLELGVLAGFLSREEVEFYKWYNKKR